MTAFRGLFVLAASMYLAACTPQATLPRGSNVLLGRVADITTDAPIGGAVVTLAVPDPGDRGSSRPQQNVMTSADGSFVFRDLAAGKYTITTTAFGYLRADYP